MWYFCTVITYDVMFFPQLERDRRQQQEGPEFLRVKARLRKTTVLDLGE